MDEQNILRTGIYKMAAEDKFNRKLVIVRPTVIFGKVMGECI